MSQTETFKGDSYEIVAWARGHRVLYFVMFGSYQGEWMLLSRDDAQYYIWKGSYGSCSGCDHYQGWHNYDEDGITREKAAEFASEYDPFVEVPASTMRNLAANDTLRQILPLNVREGFSDDDIDYDEAAREFTTLVKLDEGVPITVEDVLLTKNQETKRRALDAVGPERFIAESGAEEIARDGEDSLIRVRDHVFLHVKDSSTPRRYLLRVPPDATDVRGAKAWTFGLTAQQYRPAVET